MDYEISEQPDFIRIDFYRNPTVDTVLEIQHKLSDGYPSRRRLYCLNDTKFLMTVSELQIIAEDADKLPNQPDRVAIVTDHAPSYETARVHRHFRSHPDTEEAIFRTVAEATAWLAVTDDLQELGNTVSG